MASGTGSRKDARDKQLAHAFDTKHVDEQKKVSERYLEAAKKAGYTYQTAGKFDNVLDNAVVKQQWLAEQIRLGREELTLQEEDIELRKEDARGFLDLFREYQGTIDQWKIEDEEAAEFGLDEYVAKGRDLVQRHPKLAAKIFGDDRIRAVVEAALREEQKYLEKLREHFYDIDEKTREAVLKRFNDMNLEQRLEYRVSQIREALDAANERQMEFQTTLADVLEDNEQMASAVQGLTESKSQLEHELSACQSQEVKLKSDVAAHEQKYQALQLEARVFEDDLKQTREDKEASDKKSLDANDRADGLQAQLTSLDQANADLKLSLASSETRLSRFQKSSQLATAAEKRVTGEKIGGLEKEKGDLEREIADLKAQLDSERQNATQQLAQAVEQEQRNAQEEKKEAQAVHIDTVASLQKDLDEAKEEASQFKADSHIREIDLRKSYEESQAKVQRLDNEKSKMENEYQHQLDSLHAAQTVHDDVVASLQKDLDDTKGEASQFKADSHMREMALRTSYEESQAKVQGLENEKSELAASYEAQIKRLRRIQQKTEAKLDASSSLIQVFTRGELDLASISTLIECQRLSTIHRNRPLGDDSSRQMPRMIFKRDGQTSDLVTHAINLSVAVRSGQMSFIDSQALFNSSIYQPYAAATYPFVIDALTVILATMKRPSLPVGHFDFRVILTVLHGTAFLNYLAQAMAVESFSRDVQTLNAEVEAHLADMLGKGSIIEIVFGQVRQSVSGQSITSWLDMPTTANIQARLDVTNSDLGTNRCIAADAAVPENFVLLDQVGIDEILYPFSKLEVDKVVWSRKDQSLRLVFLDVPVSVCVAREIVLAQETSKRPDTEVWVVRFLKDEVAFE